MQKHKKVSYIRKPFAKRSFLSLGLAIAALVLQGVVVASAVMSAGEVQLNVAAVCFCSLVYSLFSLAYGITSFWEREKKYILSKIGLGISGILIIFWLVLIIIGIRG